MKKIMAIGLAIMFLMTGLMIIPEGITQDVEAETVTAATANCGTEYYEAADYYDSVDGINGVHATSMGVALLSGQTITGGGSYQIFHGVIAFNCSGVDTGGASSIRLTATGSWSLLTTQKPGNINVYYRPPTMASYVTSSFYTDTVLVGSLADIMTIPILPTNNTFIINVPPITISTGDWSAEYGAGMDTVFYLASSREGIMPTYQDEYVIFDILGASPRITTVEISAGMAIVSYYTDATTWSNFTVMPSNRLEYNATHDMFMYEIQVLNHTIYGVEWMTITVGTELNYIATHITATVTLLDAVTGEWNITDYLGGVGGDFPCFYLHMWFSVPKPQAQTQVNIAMWHSTLGEGFFWEKFKVVYTVGSAYNNTTAQWIPTSTTFINSDQTVTFSVLDYFDNLITSSVMYVSGDYMDVLITVPVYSVTFNSFRNDTTAFAIYFNGTGTPYQDHVSGGKEVKMAIRTGSYMFRFDYLTSNSTGHSTVISTFFFNLTINATYTINIGIDKISMIITNINGVSIVVGNILTGIGGLYPNVAWNLTDPIFSTSDTRSPSGVFTIADKSYLIIMSTADFTDIDTTAGATTLWAGEIQESVMYGHWSYITDTLTIAASNTTAQMRVNDTTLSTTLISSTAPAGATYDLFTNNQTSIGNNISVWVSAGGFSIRREIEFHWARELTWTYDGSSKYDCFVTLNNTLPLTLRSPKVMVTFPKLQDPKAQVDVSQIYLYDADHNVYMSPYSNFSRYADRIDWGMASISPTTLQHYKVTFYTNNETRQGTETITPIAPPDWFTYKGKDMRMVEGDYTNGLASTFQGDIIFIMTDPESIDINPSTLKVIDKTTNTELTLNTDYLLIGTTVQLLPAFVGDMHTGDTVSIRVVYLTTETSGTSQVTQDTILGIPLYMLIFIILIMFGGIAAVLYLSKKPGRKEAGKLMGQLVIATGVIAALIMFVLSTVGLIHV
jgi:hypothetical protein